MEQMTCHCHLSQISLHNPLNSKPVKPRLEVPGLSGDVPGITAPGPGQAVNSPSMHEAEAMYVGTLPGARKQGPQDG